MSALSLPGASGRQLGYLFGRLFGRPSPHPLPPAIASPQPAAAAQRWVDVEGRRLVLRALAETDADLLGRLWNDDLSRAARHMRFRASLDGIGTDRLQACCRPTPARGQALLLTQCLPGSEKALAEGCWAWAGRAGCAELSVSVADAWQGRGLGQRLVRALLQSAQAAGARSLQADVWLNNPAMQALLRRCGFEQRARCHSEDLADEVDVCGADTLRFVKDLQPQPQRTAWATRDVWLRAFTALQR